MGERSGRPESKSDLGGQANRQGTVAGLVAGCLPGSHCG